MEWRKFYPDDDERVELTTVSHVTHLHSGLSVVADGRIQSGLVYDESKLTANRVQVVWFSPNEWRYGYRYGSVRLGFSWKNLVRGRRAYWVEAITRYRPTACRILITDVDRDDDDVLARYDPAKAKGPWIHDVKTDTHYRNGKITLEVLVERDVPLTEASQLGFVAHHRQYCSASAVCPDKFEVNYGTAGARFLAAALGRRLTIRRELVFEHGREVSSIGTAMSNLRCRLRELHEDSPNSGSVKAKDSEADAIARAALSFFGNYQDDDARAVAGLFDTAEDLLAILKRMLPEFGGIRWRH